MPRFLIALAATAVMFGAAYAQDGVPTPPAAPPAPAAPVESACPPLPPQPELPDGATARNNQAMMAGDEAFRTWGEAYQAVLVCRREEVESLRNQLIEINARNQALTAQYNAGVASLNEASAAWQAEGEEYNARNNRRGR